MDYASLLTDDTHISKAHQLNKFYTKKRSTRQYDYFYIIYILTAILHPPGDNKHRRTARLDWLPTVWTEFFVVYQYVSAFVASFRLLLAKRRSAGQAGGLPDRICSSAIITGYAG